MKHMRLMSAISGIVAALLSASVVAAYPLPHERIVSGDYAFVLGWQEEPPVVGLKNAALVEVSTANDDQPVAGAEGSLTAQIVYGGQSKDLVLRPLEGQPGVYVGGFIPTRRGTYTLKLGGTVNGQPIDLSNEIEEVGSLDTLTFPEPQADLQKSITAAQNELNATRTLAIIGVAVGTIGLVLAGIALGRSRK